MRDESGFNLGDAVKMEIRLEENAESLDVEDRQRGPTNY